MTHSNIIEVYGNIFKEESLFSLKDNTLPNTCVLETPDPFYGYYGRHPQFTKPVYVYLLTKKKYSGEQILRAFKNIRKHFEIEFDACLATLDIYNNTCNAIRIKDINSYEQVSVIQGYFQDQGIQFKKKQKNIEAKGFIKTEKSFMLESTGQGIYFDKSNPLKAYIVIPHQLSWKLFEKVSIQIRNNWGRKDFDAALGTFYRYSGIEDIIRILSEELSPEFMLELKEKYLREISKI